MAPAGIILAFDEVFVRIDGETHYLWRAVDHEGEVLEGHCQSKILNT